MSSAPDVLPGLIYFYLLALGGIAVSFPFRCLVAYCAVVRGRSPLWSLLTYMFGPFALIVAALPSDPWNQPPEHPGRYSFGRECLSTLCTCLGLTVLLVVVAGGMQMHSRTSQPPSPRPAMSTPAQDRRPESPAEDKARLQAEERIRPLRNRQREEPPPDCTIPPNAKVATLRERDCSRPSRQQP